MAGFLNIAVVLLPLGYLIATVAYGLLFYLRSETAGRWAAPIFRGTLLLHFAYLVAVSWRYHQLPIATVSQALTVTAFAVAVVYAFLEWRGRERTTGVWMVGLVLIFQVLSALLPAPEPKYREVFHNPLFATHVVLALLGYAAFAIAAGYGYLFLRLYRELKRRRFATFFGRLPPLEVLERMMASGLIIGFVALTGAVVAGIVWVEELHPGSWWHDPMILFTLGTWVLYGVALALRSLRRWQGRQTALASIAGLTTIIVTLIAVNLLFSRFHEFR